MLLLERVIVIIMYLFDFLGNNLSRVIMVDFNKKYIKAS